MFKVKQLGVAAAITLFAGAAMASNFRAADQVYVPAAGHISSSSATFVSDVFISNLSDDSVDVSVIWRPEPAARRRRSPKVLTLAAARAPRADGLRQEHAAPDQQPRAAHLQRLQGGRGLHA